MEFDPVQGILLHAAGGFAAGSFYVPLKKIRGWSWETAWLCLGLAAWIMAPLAAAWSTNPRLGEVICACLSSHATEFVGTFIFGVLWGFGNLTYGLAARYLGIALGGSIALGFCMLIGTITPPIVHGTALTLFGSPSGFVVLFGIFACTAGIAMCGAAGHLREKECSASSKATGAENFRFAPGIVVAVLSGLLSACFAFGLDAGDPLAKTSIELGTNPIYSNNVVLIVLLAGGFTSNALCCLAMNILNNTYAEYFQFNRAFARNIALSWLGGITWFLQFFFYGMGQTKLSAKLDFASWAIHMALVVVFVNLWGLLLHEWQGTSMRTRALVCCGMLVLVGSTALIALGNTL
jgi:L-rhamnose-H+ transport protein